MLVIVGVFVGVITILLSGKIFVAETSELTDLDQLSCRIFLSALSQLCKTCSRLTIKTPV